MKTFLKKLFLNNFEAQSMAFLSEFEKHVKEGLFLKEDLLQLETIREYFIKLRLQVLARPESVAREEWLRKYDWIDSKLLLLRQQFLAGKIDSAFFEAVKDLKA